MANANKRMALLVGCNYPNSEYKLHGCINDVNVMKDLLVERCGFEPTSIELLKDDGPGSKVMPTGANIRKALNRMVDEAKEGDLLFFHFSGHGTLLKHHHKRDEAIVPCDFNLITDVDFRQLVDRLPKGATITILSDSCHSGGLIDKEKEQVGPECPPPPPKTDSRSGCNFSKPKSIPYESLVASLGSLTNVAESDIGVHLTTLFGDEASLKFRLSKVDLDQLFGKVHGPDSAILLSGCETNESSIDMPAGPGHKAQGAFSYAVQSILKRRQGPISNKELVVLAGKMLKEEGLNEQHPCLYCSDENVEAPFLLWNVGSNI